MKSRFWLFALFLAAFFARSAPTGYCVPDNGVYHNNFQFAEQLTMFDNLVGMIHSVMIDNGTMSFKGTCYCLTGKNETYKYAYITSIVNPALRPTAVRRDINYYDLNDQLDIGLTMYVLGKGYISVPFDHMPNDTGGHYGCHDGISSATTFYSGGSGFVYLYVKRHFTGVVTVPRTVVANIYATIDPQTVSHEVIADVIIEGTLTVPQTCEIDEGQAIMFDFKRILASEFPSTKGEALDRHKITRQVNIKCSNMFTTDKLGATIQASGSSPDGTMVATNNPDVGIKIYDKRGREVNVNGGALSAETTQSPATTGDMLGTLTFSGAPASATGAKPQPGPFSATATLTIEIIN
ncbi:fimbrial protein [Enterobacter cancerogenus]|uniref:fimbrial protein n=1 Tax=Enterobacter cancerogenus TaxID=69218 RepID=UPI00307637DA